MNTSPNTSQNIRARLHEIIFEAETPAGKLFDVVLLWSILLSVVLVALESVKEIEVKISDLIFWGEWIFTILFSIEFILRFMVVKKKLRYIFSFFGLVDLLSILPSYIALVYPGSHYFLMLRVLRLLRVFRVFKLARFTKEGQVLMQALSSSRPKIIMFLGGVVSMTVVVGSIMYVIEGEQNGFTSIPRSIYWAIVTMTTVGYGDIAPQTPLGQLLASLVMLLGYGIIAVPTGIVTAEITRANVEIDTNATNTNQFSVSSKNCMNCSAEGHDTDAIHCKWCGEILYYL